LIIPEQRELSTQVVVVVVAPELAVQVKMAALEAAE
jgi:hypothetical protein